MRDYRGNDDPEGRWLLCSRPDAIWPPPPHAPKKPYHPLLVYPWRRLRLRGGRSSLQRAMALATRGRTPMLRRQVEMAHTAPAVAPGWLCAENACTILANDSGFQIGVGQFRNHTCCRCLCQALTPPSPGWRGGVGRVTGSAMNRRVYCVCP
jgi:hypothetical protein